ncbi:MAG: hypothetical protein ACOY35_14365 [Bacillota bacterium]
MKVFKKLIASILVLSVLSVSMVLPSSGFAAQSNNVSQTVFISTEENVQEARTAKEANPSVSVDSNIKSTNGEISPKSVPTYVSKKALRWAINNTTTITNLVGKYAGKDVAIKVGQVMNTHVKPALRQLERLDKVTYGKLEETLYDVMKKPIGTKYARIGAKTIVTIIEVFAPI